MIRAFGCCFATVLLLATGGIAAAQGTPQPWQFWHPEPAAPLMSELDGFHMLLLWIMVAICALVVALIVFVCIRFRASRNPTPSRASHNTVLEVVWTVVPVALLIVIAVPSFRLLYHFDRAVDPEMTVKVTGLQWYWEYNYPDHGGFSYASLMVPEDQLREGQPRLLAVDNRLVLPVDTTVRILVTGSDVLHSWAVPALGVKMDAVPGQLNETWAHIEEEGVYYGQCSQICGTNHAYMPVAVEAVSKERFDEWVRQAQTQFGAASPDRRTRLAGARQEIAP